MPLNNDTFWDFNHRLAILFSQMFVRKLRALWGPLQYIIVFVTFVFNVTLAQATHPACFLLEKNIKKMGVNYLLDLDNLKPTDLVVLSLIGVYKVPLRDGSYGVIRLDNAGNPFRAAANQHDVRFETFSTLVSGLLDRPLPIPVELELSEKLKKLILEVNQRAMGSSNPTPREIVAANFLPFYPGMTGANYLQKTLGIRFREKLANYSILISNKKSRGENIENIEIERGLLVGFLKDEWQALDSGLVRQTVLEDLRKSLKPNETLFVDQEKIWNDLETVSNSNDPLPFSNLELQGFERLSKPVQKEMAEYWALFTLMGIPDFHANNWMIYEEHVIPIDLAFRSRQFTKSGSEPYFVNQQNPLTGQELAPELVALFKKNWSKGFIDKIKHLTLAQIKLAAQQARFPITDYQAEATLLRAQNLLKK